MHSSGLRRSHRRGNSSSSACCPTSSSSSSLRHHNKLIPTLFTSHPRQSCELGARQGRARAQGKGCRATARLGLTVTRVLMAGLLGDGDGDVSRGDVSPRDVSLCRGCCTRDGLRAPLRQKQKEEASGGGPSVIYMSDLFDSILSNPFYSTVQIVLKVVYRVLLLFLLFLSLLHTVSAFPRLILY